jgi:hypothetical protein
MIVLAAVLLGAVTVLAVVNPSDRTPSGLPAPAAGPSPEAPAVPAPAAGPRLAARDAPPAPGAADTLRAAEPVEGEEDCGCDLEIEAAP